MEKWLAAEASELASLESKGVFTPTVLPQGKSLINTRWVFALKYKNGEIARFKARLVAKSFEQIAGIDSKKILIVCWINSSLYNLSLQKKKLKSREVSSVILYVEVFNKGKISK